MTIALTDDLREAINQQPGVPLLIVDPRTQESYVLVPAAAFDRIHHLRCHARPVVPEQFLTGQKG